jgi:hypothetical protein
MRFLCVFFWRAKTSRLRRGESNSTSKVWVGVGLGVVSTKVDSLRVSTYVEALAVEKKLGEVSALGLGGTLDNREGVLGPVVIVVGREGFTHRRQTVREALGSTSRLSPSKLIWHVSGTNWPLTLETPVNTWVIAPLVSVCKSDCSAFEGSNPPLATAQNKRLQPSKYMDCRRFVVPQ